MPTRLALLDPGTLRTRGDDILLDPSAVTIKVICPVLPPLTQRNPPPPSPKELRTRSCGLIQGPTRSSPFRSACFCPSVTGLCAS